MAGRGAGRGRGKAIRELTLDSDEEDDMSVETSSVVSGASSVATLVGQPTKKESSEEEEDDDEKWNPEEQSSKIVSAGRGIIIRKELERLRVGPQQPKSGGRGRGKEKKARTSSSSDDDAETFSVASSFERPGKSSEASKSVKSRASVIEGMKSKEKPRLPTVIKMGKEGLKQKVSTNFVNITFEDEGSMFEHHVDFVPDIDNLQLRKDFIRSLSESLGSVKTFDGMKLCLPNRLEKKIMEYKVPNPNDEEEMVTIRVTFTRVTQMSEGIHFFNVLFRRIMRVLGYKELYRNFFDFRKTHDLNQHKLQIWPGLVTSIDEFEGGLKLCMDTSARVLRTTSVLEYINTIENDPKLREKLESFIVGKIIITRYNNRTYKITGIDWNSTPLSEFDKNGKMTSYFDYYRKQYNIKIENLKQPLLIHLPKPRRDQDPDDIKITLLIPELCFPTGLTDEQKSNFNIMRDISQYTRLVPAQRIEGLKEFLKNFDASEEAKQIFKDWGLILDQKVVEVDAHIQKAPTIAFGEKKVNVTADFGRESTSNKCHQPIKIKNWQIFCTRHDEKLADNFLKTYDQVAGPLGIAKMGKGQMVTVRGRNIPDFLQALNSNIKEKDTQFVVVILPGPGLRDDLYAAIKKHCLCLNSIPSQMVLGKTLLNEKRVRSVMQKIVLQINCKLGGPIWSLHMPMKDRVLAIGLDTYHDPKRKEKSACAIVAALNNECTKYFSNVYFQKPQQEIMEGIQAAMKKIITAYLDENGNRSPDAIIVFRDGVSDGQLEQTKTIEVVQMKTAINSFCKNTPNFTYIIVQKRIPERFFAHLSNVKVDNPRPGTVVDYNVTRRTLFDFFLVSQIVRQGTVSPTHYIVLEDNSELQPDFIQKYAYALTFMYFNWPGAVRVPAMCQYAHKLATLAGEHLKTEPTAENANKLYYL